MNIDVIQSIYDKKSDYTPCITILRKSLTTTGVYQVRLYENVC